MSFPQKITSGIICAVPAGLVAVAFYTVAGGLLDGLWEGLPIAAAYWVGLPTALAYFLGYFCAPALRTLYRRDFPMTFVWVAFLFPIAIAVPVVLVFGTYSLLSALVSGQLELTLKLMLEFANRHVAEWVSLTFIGESLAGALSLLLIIALPITVISSIGSLAWGIYLRRVPF